MKRMQEEKDFNNLQDDVNNLKDSKIYIHQITANVIDEDSKIRTLSMRLESRKNLSIADSFNNLIELVEDNINLVGYDYAYDEFILLDSTYDDHFEIYTTDGSTIRIEGYPPYPHYSVMQITKIL